MNSSISTSERGWRRLLTNYLAWSLGLGFAVATAIIVLDPYDTGRFAVFGDHGVPRFGQRLAVASLARQSNVDTAIIGNSTIQLIDPARLDEPDVRHAVSLAIPGTGPLEQLSVARWFMRHHVSGSATLIFGIDASWCDVGPPKLTNPFPFWLYSADPMEYLANIIRYQSVESAARKVRLLFGFAEPARSDGYNDYDIGRVWDRVSFGTRVGSVQDGSDLEGPVEPPTNFPAARLLRDFFAELPNATMVVMVMPPQFHPPLHGANAAQWRACAGEFRSVADQRQHSAFINFLPRSDLTERDENYWDIQHYRAPIARVMERDIVAALNRLRS
jgi:hypothetical protein